MNMYAIVDVENEEGIVMSNTLWFNLLLLVFVISRM